MLTFKLNNKLINIQQAICYTGKISDSTSHKSLYKTVLEKAQKRLKELENK